MSDNTVQYCDDDLTCDKQTNIRVCMLLTVQLTTANVRFELLVSVFMVVLQLVMDVGCVSSRCCNTSSLLNPE